MRYALIGSKDIGLQFMRVLRQEADLVSVVTIDDSTDTRSRLGTFREAGAVVVGTRQEADTVIASLDADRVLVAGWYWLIDPLALAVSTFIGVHHSMLPQYRGGSPLVWALIEGCTEIGTSFFSLTAQADAGPIWAQTPVAVTDGYIGSALRDCNSAALTLLRQLLHDSLVPWPQDESRATWRRQRTPTDGLIDWTMPASTIVREIRAQSRPYPGAYSWADVDRVTIWRASPSSVTLRGQPGLLLGNRVVCGDGAAIIIEEATAPNGRSIDRMSGMILGSGAIPTA